MSGALTLETAGLDVDKVSADNPIAASRFSLTIDGTEIASFSELAGIASAVDVVEYVSSSDNETLLKKLTGARKPATVILKRGKNGAIELQRWHDDVLRRGDAALRNCSLVIYHFDGKPVARYHLEHAWPSKVQIGALRAGSSEVLMETVTITCEFIQRVSV
jgi:phage tail-like protein